MTEESQKPYLDAPDGDVRRAASKKPYSPPKLVPIGSVRDLTMKNGSVADQIIAGLTKPGRNPM